MTSHEAAELISLGLTIPTILLGGFVVCVFGPTAMQAVRDKGVTSRQWLLVGITIGFVGQILDNLYWQFAWTASYLGMEVKDSLFNSGVFFNIVSRQALGITAAACHIWAAFRTGGDTAISKMQQRTAWTLCVGAFILGLAYSVGLYFISR